MNFFQRRGQLINFDWLIGAIVGITIASILITVAIQWYATTKATEQSFDELIVAIEKLKDGETSMLVYALPEDHVLVSFSKGNDFRSQSPAVSSVFSEESCAGEDVRIPEAVCGDSPCLCVCDGSWKYGYEEACIEDVVACHPFMSEGTKDIKLGDTECTAGVYREGPDNGVFTLYLKRKGNVITFCTTKDCVTEKQQKAIEATEQLLIAYESCLTDKDDCACSLDFAFFKENPYAILFEEKKVSVWDIEKEQVLSEKDLSISLTTTLQGLSEGMYLYTFEEFHSAALGETRAYFLVASPTASDIETSAETRTEKQIVVAETLYKKEQTMLIVEPSFDFSSIASCTPEEKNENKQDVFAIS